MFEAFFTVLLVANVVPILPVILRFCESLDRRERRAFLLRAVVAGNLIAIATALSGRYLLAATQLTSADLRIAGGVILLVFCVYDLLFSREQRKLPLEEVVVSEDRPNLVPMAVPLMIGPAVLTAVMVVAEEQGRFATVVAIVANASINAVILLVASKMHGHLGGGLGRGVGKIFGLILAALAVSMVRGGLAEIAAGSP